VHAQPRTSASRYNYLVKPFSVAELLARIAAKLRYAAPQAGLMPRHLEAAALSATAQREGVASPLVNQRSISAVVRQIGPIISILRKNFKVASAIREKARPTSHEDIYD